MRKRLQVILSHGGIASRRRAVEIIEQGRVCVNGAVVREKGAQFDPGEDKIEIDGIPIREERKTYYVVNKPKGYITTVRDEKNRKTVLDLVPRSRARVYPVGRLDKDTEGVLLLTNDGDLAHRLTHPRFGLGKVYMVELKDPLKPGSIGRIEKGVFLDGKKTARCKITILSKTHNKSCLRIELHEGRKRQIRRMILRFGGKVTRLRRISYAGISAEGLRSGMCRALTRREVNSLKKKCLL